MRYAARKLAWGAILCAAVGGVILAGRLGLLGTRPPADGEKYGGKTFRVVAVVDGDTLDIDVADVDYPHTRIRLWGVDTPETLKENTPVQHFGPEASRFTKRLCMGQDVRIELDERQTRDRYGRLLAYVFLPDGQMLNRRLVAEGCAYADPRYGHKHFDEFRRLQNEARKARGGLWRQVTKDDLPYYYRNSLKLPEPDTQPETAHAP